MNILRGLASTTVFKPGCVMTIGNFDGMHRGHVAIIAALKALAFKHGLPAVVMTFDPQPREYFARDKAAPARLASFREKMLRFMHENVDHVICLPFNAKIANLAADEFVKTILVGRFNLRHVITGDDFQFGRGRAGDVALLQRLGGHYAFHVSSTPTLTHAHERISSSRIRQALANHDFALAAALLGRPYTLEGRVIYGHQRGRTLGFPTANIALRRDVSPVHGVYVVHVYNSEGRRFQGVANVGVRPTLYGSDRLLEVHLFDVNADLYGTRLRVEFLSHLRDEQKFESVQHLQQHITRDALAARDYFNRIQS